MMKHSTIQHQLYDFVRGGLSPEDHEAVASHLCTCTACARDVQDFRALLEGQDSVLPDPAAGLPTEFWRTLLDDV